MTLSPIQEVDGQLAAVIAASDLPYLFSQYTTHIIVQHTAGLTEKAQKSAKKNLTREAWDLVCELLAIIDN